MAKLMNPNASALSCGSTHRNVRSIEPTSDVECNNTVMEKIIMYIVNVLHCNEHGPGFAFRMDDGPELDHLDDDDDEVLDDEHEQST